MLNDHDLAMIFFLTSATLLVSTITLAVAWVRARERVLRDRAEEPMIRPVADASPVRINTPH
jgi:hypothetical protein